MKLITPISKEDVSLLGFALVITFFHEAVCNSSTGQLLRGNNKAFRVEIGIPFSLTSTPYNKNTFAF